MREGEIKPQEISVPAGSLRERLGISQKMPIGTENQIVSIALYLQNAPNFKEEIESLNSDEKILLFEKTTEAASQLFKKLNELIIVAEEKRFSQRDLTTEMKEANTCIQYLYTFEEHLLLDNQQKILLEALNKKMREIEKNNE